MVLASALDPHAPSNNSSGCDRDKAEWEVLRSIFGEMHASTFYDASDGAEDGDYFIIPLREVVKYFESHTGSWSEILGFDLVTKLTELTPSQARELLACEWPNDLNLAGITTLEADVASELANTKDNFYLGNLTALSTDTAAALAKSKCTYIGLWGLDNIDTDTAKALISIRRVYCCRSRYRRCIRFRKRRLQPILY